MVEQDIIKQFTGQGYAVVASLFTPEEVERIRAHYMVLNEAGHGYEGDRPMLTDGDPLLKYPRIVHPHRWDDVTLRWLLDERLRQWTTALLEREPYAAQTMFYFKPPGARGQALHQDQRSLAVKPGTCLAAWMAVDDCDEENGCMQVVPGTQDLPELCLIEADTSQSFTSRTVPLDNLAQPVPVPMKAGDVMFFNGQVIHGSFPNVSNRFRRALIAHYIVGEAEKVAEFYHPVLTFDGAEVALESSRTGGPCGIWVDEEGQQVLKITDTP
jgi:hypothetical protein